jgi:hypothetical protein
LTNRYVVYDPNDVRRGSVLPDATLGQIILGEGDTITKALSIAKAPAGSVVWDRKEGRIAYVVPDRKA